MIGIQITRKYYYNVSIGLCKLLRMKNKLNTLIVF